MANKIFPLEPLAKIRYPRLLLAALALTTAMPLAIAATLQPSPDGIGTHQQLGFPACFFRTQFAMRCPSCGMTTAWAHWIRGNIAESFAANAGGFCLATLAAAIVLTLAIFAAIGRFPGRRWAVALAWSLGISIAVSLIDWAIRTDGLGL